ncbi:melanocortin receptor 4-like [Oculina patagonica]
MTEKSSVTTNCSFMVDNEERRSMMVDTNIAVIVLNSVFALTATIQNLPVIYAILKTPSLHNPPYILLCSLASTDLFVGCVIQPLYIAHNAMLVSGQSFSCGLWMAKETLLLLFMFVSISTLVLISTERWLALHFHLRYREIVTVSRTLMSIGATWFFCIVSVIAWPLGLDLYIFTMIGITVITIAAILLLFTYIKIFLILRRHKALIQNQAKLHPPSVNIRKHKKSSATMLYVVVLFFIFYAPTFYAMIHYLDLGEKFASVSQTILWEVAKTVALINASANPLMYYWKMREMRRAVRNVFGLSSATRVQVGDVITPGSGSMDNEYRSRTEQIRKGSFSVRPRGSWSNVAHSRSDLHQDQGTEAKPQEEKKLFLLPRFLEPGPSFEGKLG